MSFYDAKKMEALGKGVMVGQAALTDSGLLNLARGYKKNVASRYRLLNEGDIASIESTQLHASLKLDGQLHFLCKSGEDCFLFNIKGRVITGLPLLEEAKKAFAKIDKVILAGELYVNSSDSRSRVYDVTSALGTGAGEKAQVMSFAAFDLLELNRDNCRALAFVEKQKKLSELLPLKGQCHSIEHHNVDTKNLSQLYKSWVTDGDQEGIVCVDEQNHTIYKIKPKHNIDAVILGFTESPDVADSLRVLLTGLMRPDGSFQVFAKVGTGFDDEQRREFYKKLKAMAVPSAYRTTDRNHTLFTMVRPEIVIEFAFHDLIYENSAGKPEMKPVLTYNAAEGYKAQLPQPFVSLLGPVFKRIRDDKSVTPEDLRLTQLQSFVELDNLEKGAESLDLAQSSVVKREVYKKETKGLISVRKFIAWKTNKEKIDSNYPAFVFCYTDYSPGRKDPLKRVLRTAPDESSLNEIFNTFKEEEVKKGWALAS
jgi:ATP dependent DNA ligase C terminal region/ATP dependent DNA ligase domain